MDDEKLIEYVRKYEFLYNLKHPKYMDTNRKDVAWKEIAEQLKQSAAACKERWQSLRDAYRRAISKKKGRKGKAAKNIKPWKYENEMAFILPFFVKRKPSESVEIKSEDEESDSCGNNLCNLNDQNHSAAQFLMKGNTRNSMEIKIENEDADNCTDNQYQSMDPLSSEIRNAYIPVNDPTYCSNNNIQTIESNDTIKKLKATKRKITESEETASTILMARLLADQHKLGTIREQNELDCFFLTISNTVKKFSPYLQALAKNKIFMLVSEMELQQLAPLTPTTMPMGPT